MANCLVTRLKAVVDNDNLEKIGCFILKKNQVDSSFNANLYVALRTNGSAKATSRDSVFLNNSGESLGSELTIPSQGYDYYVRLGLPKGVFDFPRSIITRITTTYNYPQAEIPIHAFNNLPGLTYASFIFSGSMDDFRGLENLETWIFKSQSPISGDIKNFAKAPKLKSLQMTNVSNTSLYGDISELGVLTSLEEFSVNTGGNGITGNLEDFVRKQRINGRATGEVSMLIYGPTIYFNGTRCYASSAKTLSWTASTMTYDGTTINE